MANLTGNKIKDTFNKLLQLDNGIIQNGTGSTVSATINSLTASNGFQGNLEGTASFTLTSSYATTASYLNPVTNGYVVLTQVSQSLNFVDDTAAAAGGVPLGGLYRNGNFISIRIV
jgi:hypothetical protein